MSEKSVILHVEITLPQADTESVVGSAGTHFAISINLHVPVKKIVVKMGKKRPSGVLEQFVVGDLGKTDEDAKRETHIDSEDVDVVSGAPALAISGFECQGFIFSEAVRKKDWRDRLYRMVFLTPLDLRNVSFQIFKIYH